MRLLCLCLLTVAVRATDIVGTDAIVDTLGPALTERAAINGTKLVLRLDGSLPARDAVREGKADLAIVFLREADNIDKAADGKAIRRYPLGSAAAYVYVHPSNPLREIDLATLANIFGAGQRGDYKFWSDVPGLKLAEPILAFSHSPDRSMAQPLFQGIALGGRAFKPGVRQRIDLPMAQEAISSRTNAILVSATVLPEKFGRLLKVADGREGRSPTAYSPDDTNVFNGDYPLRIPLVLCVKEDRVAANAETIRWLLSEAAAAKVRQSGIIPSPKLIRDRLAQRLDSK